jgi:hypothetical protein
MDAPAFGGSQNICLFNDLLACVHPSCPWWNSSADREGTARTMKWRRGSLERDPPSGSLRRPLCGGQIVQPNVANRSVAVIQLSDLNDRTQPKAATATGRFAAIATAQLAWCDTTKPTFNARRQPQVGATDH